MIVFIRCDDRLIHGQCQTKIIPLNKITRVIGVDDATATNPMLKRIFEMAAPQGVKVTVHTFDDALTPIRKCMINEKRTLIITRRPSTLLKIYQAVPDLVKTVNVANIPKEKDGFWVRRDIWINEEELAALKELDQLGISIQFQQFPGDGQPELYFKDIKDQH